MIPETHLVIARFAPRMQRQAGEILDFGKEKLRILAGGKVIETFAYPELERLVYRHYPRRLGRAFQLFGGNLLQRREASIQLKTAQKYQEIYLETDLEFRENELYALFKGLYRAGVPLEEYAFSGNRLFLLAPAAGKNLKLEIAALENE